MRGYPTSFKGGVQPPFVFLRTFQFQQQVLESRLPNSLDCGAQFIRVDTLFEFAQGPYAGLMSTASGRAQ